jgi:hypothetical protein
MAIYKSITKHLRSLQGSSLQSKQSRVLLVVITVIVGVLGVHFLIGSHAATPYASTTADTGTLVSPASKLTSCSGSSDGGCVQFGTTSSGGGGSTQTTNCFPSPGACGDPDPNFAWNSASAWAAGGGGVGPNNGTTATSCSSLPSSGSVESSSNGQIIQNLNISGTLEIDNNNVTVKNVCVTDPTTDLNEVGAVVLSGSGDEVDDSIIQGSAANNGTKASGGVQNGVSGSGTLKHDFIQHCDTCVHSGPWTIADSYIMQDSDLSVLGQKAYGHCDEDEDVYTADVQMTFTHDVLLASPQQTCPTAVIFGDTGGGGGGKCDNKWTVTNTLLAGENYITEPCANANGAGSSSINFSNDSIARCGSSACSPNSHGYFQNGGEGGVQVHNYCSPSETWTNVVWDDNGQTISCD